MEGRSRLRRLLALAGAVGRQELRVLLLVGLVAGGLWLFVALADEVGEGEVESFDTAILHALREPDDPGDPLGPEWFEDAARDVTALGSLVVLGLATLVTAGALLLQGHRRAAGLTVAVIAGALALNQALKAFYARPRPELVPHAARVFTASFPSAHAMLSAVVYLTLGALVAQVQVHWRVKAFVLACAVLLALAVGASRVYLGVHYPTDVLAGWAIGAAWAALGWVVALWFRRRRARAD